MHQPHTQLSEAISTRTRHVAQRFTDAAQHYDGHAHIQKRVASNLWTWAKTFLEQAPPEACLDIGSGTGFLTAHLLKAYPDTPIHVIDTSQGMLDELKKKHPHANLVSHCGNGETFHLCPWALDIPKSSIAFSNLCIQWFDQPAQALASWLHVADKIVLSVLLDGSFEAWRAAHHSTHQACGLQKLPSLAEFDEALQHIQATGEFRLEHKVENLVDVHPDGLSFVRSLRAIGADTPRPGHRPARLRPVLESLGSDCAMNYRVAYYFLERT